MTLVIICSDSGALFVKEQWELTQKRPWELKAEGRTGGGSREVFGRGGKRRGAVEGGARTSCSHSDVHNTVRLLSSRL